MADEQTRVCRSYSLILHCDTSGEAKLTDDKKGQYKEHVARQMSPVLRYQNLDVNNNRHCRVQTHFQITTFHDHINFCNRICIDKQPAASDKQALASGRASTDGSDVGGAEG